MRRIGWVVLWAALLGASGCDSGTGGQTLGQRGALLFGYGAWAQPIPLLHIGQEPQEICVWRNDPNFAAHSDSGDPAFFLNDGVTLESSNAAVATFAIDALEKQCLSVALIGSEGTADLIVKNGGSEIDRVTISVAQ
jgi:hypothetical protein